ncbi:MAG: thioredoxin domain-containing protein [Gammaproteobacteria bacterium]
MGYQARHGTGRPPVIIKPKASFRTCTGAVVLLLLASTTASITYADLVQKTVESYLQTNRAAGNRPNSLIHENSPYLLQHAYNPVQWYAWGDEAFELARQQNKPIFLSIGYSTCYWCHVMAHESFENEAIAAILNEHFIAIKLDREERPDIDDVYMAATQLINGYGGWPMTVFLNHDLEPFHAGVYYPPVTTENSLGLTELLKRVVELWRDDNKRVNLIADRISSNIQAGADESMTGASIDSDVRDRAVAQISAVFDSEHGGFGAAPKFPRPGKFALLLDVVASEDRQAKQALNMLVKTLTAMSQGGIYDHAGGGFHRYSVDDRWQVPHFEKMLYTQALMSIAYTRLYQVEPDRHYRDVVAGTLDFVLREMRHANGGFYSALDAASERPDQPGVQAEGAYYLWSATQLESLLTEEEWRLVKTYYAIADDGNIQSDPQGEFGRSNILYVSDEFKGRSLDEEQAALIDKARRKLYQARLSRPRPHLDDKMITAWNGMMITALVEAYSVFEDERYLDAAIDAAAFIQEHLFDSKTQRLYRRLRDGEVGIDATLDDYVWTVNGLLALYKQTNSKRWLLLARQMTEQQLQRFYDGANGGFYESGPDKNLLFRSRTVYDGALPAPNAIAVENLATLARLTDDKKWQRIANQTLDAFAGSINSNPAAAAWMLTQVKQPVSTGQ